MNKTQNYINKMYEQIKPKNPEETYNNAIKEGFNTTEAEIIKNWQKELNEIYHKLFGGQ